MNHIVDMYPLTKFEGELKLPHDTDNDAVMWLESTATTALVKWHGNFIFTFQICINFAPQNVWATLNSMHRHAHMYYTVTNSCLRFLTGPVRVNKVPCSLDSFKNRIHSVYWPEVIKGVLSLVCFVSFAQCVFLHVFLVMFLCLYSVSLYCTVGCVILFRVCCIVWNLVSRPPGCNKLDLTWAMAGLLCVYFYVSGVCTV